MSPLLFWSPVLVHLWQARRVPTRLRRHAPPGGLLSIPPETRSLRDD
ncbi:hypothetical protein [Gemmobacter sp.]|nr:hypothetical protein [Gemmobacter sp.]